MALDKVDHPHTLHAASLDIEVAEISQASYCPRPTSSFNTEPLTNQTEVCISRFREELPDAALKLMFQA